MRMVNSHVEEIGSKRVENGIFARGVADNLETATTPMSTPAISTLHTATSYYTPPE